MAKDIILFGILICLAVIFVIGFNALNPDFMRYEVYHNDGNPCFIKDWETGERLKVTPELLEKSTGEWTPCDPSLCE